MQPLHKLPLAAIGLAIVLIGLIVILVLWWSKIPSNMLAGGNSQFAAAIAVDLATATDFAVLADTAITNTPTSVISGDVALGPTSGGSDITGLTTAEVSGTIYAMDAAGPAGAGGNNPAVVNAAKSALTAAYIDAAGQTPDTTYTPIYDLAPVATTLTPGVYKGPSSLGITGILTLDAGGDANAVFIFQAGSTLITEVGSQVVLINGAQSCNVFWQVGSSATLKTNSEFYGNILALSSITLQNGASVEGSVLARNGAVTLDNNIVNKVPCVIPPPPPAPATSSGGGYNAPLPLINVTKIPSPLALPEGPGSVTDTYVVTNVGVVAMSGIWARDTLCSPVTYVSGDSDTDSKLDTDEAWTYRCTRTVATTETNTITAHGQANGWDGYDSANATVAVGVAFPPPLIHLVKKPNVFVLPAGGGAVTYTYTVTNPGTAPLSNVSVVDDKCTGLPGRVVGHPGDLNKNDLLENNESWTFTCQTNLTTTTTNTGTAEGHANGLTAIDFSPATVVVSDPGLPNTGLPMDRNKALEGLVLLLSVIIVSIALGASLKIHTGQTH